MKTKLSKITSVALALVLVCLMCITASASGLTGDGTKNNPYIIGTADQLDAFSQMVAAGDDFSGKFIALDADITVNAGFAPIGSEAAPFRGVFNGNGKTLSGFDVSCENAGLFGYTDGAVISDLTVEGSFRATSYAGAVAAFAKDTVIEGCNASALVYASSYTGGIAGYLESGKIAFCTTTNEATVGSSTGECVGGIAGFAGGEITDCTNNAYTYGTKNIGGIAGYSTGAIISSTNTVAVNATKTNLGGIAGLTEGSVKYCKNTGKISTNDANAGKVGGIAGVTYNAVITECMNSGAVTATGSFAGGIAGYATSTEITNCIVTADTSANGTYAGGIFGFALEGKTEKCVTAASVTAKNNTAGAVGAIAQGTVADCYYNSAEISKAVLSGTAANTSGLSAAELTSKDALAALDFTNIWTINTLHAAYPILTAIPYHTLELSVSTEASCTEDGQIKGMCTICAEEIDEITPAFGHSFTVVSSEAPGCTSAGYKDLLCSICSTTDTAKIPATGHTDSNGDDICDTCNTSLKEKEPEKEKTIFEKIADFFRSIIEWLKGLFVK